MKRVKLNENLLRAKIAIKGYNRNELADKLKISPQTVTNVIKGHHNPSYDLINRIYYALELTPEEGHAIFFEPNLRVAKDSERGD